MPSLRSTPLRIGTPGADPGSSRRGAPASAPDEEPRAQIPRGVDGQTRVHGEAHGDGAHQGPDGGRRGLGADGSVVLVQQRQDAQDQQRRAHELGQEAREVAHVLVRERREDGLRLGAVRVHLVEHRPVQDVHEERGHVGGHDLVEDVERHLLPRQQLEQRQRGGHGRVQVRARHAAADSDAEEEGEALAQRDGDEAAAGLAAQHGLRHARQPEEHGHEGGHELGHHLLGELALDHVRHVLHGREVLQVAAGLGRADVHILQRHSAAEGKKMGHDARHSTPLKFKAGVTGASSSSRRSGSAESSADTVLDVAR
ncbi:unnamed protein product [Phytophthora lilii]|uniref:Unnamed protein product n=1 Tax=Phytophthora lilii TaxID=2077276 RepID=A0A9W6X2I7_9STRA|nr:unnamed protein product [Phytophthora lilii]